MEYETILRQHGTQIGIFLVGLTLIGIGMIKMMEVGKGNQVEISDNTNEVSETKQIVVVDVAGAVEKPGLYKLEGEVRVGDALVTAGGLSVNADREWVARFVNQAQKVEDGTKIYIPVKGENVEKTQGIRIGRDSVIVSGQGSIISINNASKSQLMELNGIGEVRADDIIANRPYTKVDELISKAKIPKSIVEKNTDKLGI